MVVFLLFLSALLLYLTYFEHRKAQHIALLYKASLSAGIASSGPDRYARELTHWLDELPAKEGDQIIRDLYGAYGLKIPEEVHPSVDMELYLAIRSDFRQKNAELSARKQ